MAVLPSNGSLGQTANMSAFSVPDLPIVPFLGDIERLILERGSLVLAAAPGSGKTSLVPLALAHSRRLSGKVLVLEPRRVACVQAAVRAAELAGEAVGESVGYRVRLDSRTSPRTRLEFVTEGVFVRMIQNDPALADVGLVVFDEFHERSVSADLALAFALESRALKPELRILVMSATLDTDRVSDFLGAPVLTVPGRAFPVETRHEPLARGGHFAATRAEGLEAAIARITRKLLTEIEGDILVFLPGTREIRRVAHELAETEAEVLPLHGLLPLADQRRIILPSGGSRRRIILATSVAETSLTVPRITAVVDSGLARLERFQARTGLNRLVTEREAKDRAEQRRGRAGRLRAGLCVRVWPETDTLPERTEPEMLRAELSALVLEAALWGARKPADIPFLDTPPAASWNAAHELLTELGALDDEGRPTAFGREAAALGTEPRLAALVLRGAARGRIREATSLAALLTESSAEADLEARLTAMLRGDKGYEGARAEAARLSRAVERLAPSASEAAAMTATEGGMGTLLAAAFPDRIACRIERRPDGAASFRLPGGRRLAVRGALAESAWIVAADADAGGYGAVLEPRATAFQYAADEGIVFSGAALSESEALAALAPLVREELEFEWEGLICKARRRRRAEKLLLAETALASPSREELGAALTARIATEGLDFLPWEEGGPNTPQAFLVRARWFCATVGAELSSGRGGGPYATDLAPQVITELTQRLAAPWLRENAALWLAPFVKSGAGPAVDGAALRHALESLLPWELRRVLDRYAPERLLLPSGAQHRVHYRANAAPSIEARVQEFYGLCEHPTIMGVPVVLTLLSPAGRPLQITADLPGFWRGSWAEARKELKGRYPKHDWPEDPALATPSARGLKIRQ